MLQQSLMKEMTLNPSTVPDRSMLFQASWAPVDTDRSRSGFCKRNMVANNERNFREVRWKRMLDL